MKFEFNLVESSTQFSTTVNLVERSRVLLENDTPAEILSEAFKFLVENLEVISATVTNSEVVNFLRSAATLSLSDYLSVKYSMSQSGLDLLVYCLDDDETSNTVDIEKDMYEYNIINSNFVVGNFVPSITKSTVSRDSNLISEIYQKAYDQNELLSVEVVGPVNTLSSSITQLMETEKMTGKIITGLSSFIDTTLDYFGVRIVVILPAKDSL